MGFRRHERDSEHGGEARSLGLGAR